MPSSRGLEVAHHGVGVMLTQGFLARTVARLGDFGRADTLYVAAAGEGRTAHAPGVVVEILTRRAEAAAMAGDVVAAREHLALAERDRTSTPPATVEVVRLRVEGVVVALAGDDTGAETSFDAARMLAPLDVTGDPAILAVGPLLAARRHARLMTETT